MKAITPGFATALGGEATTLAMCWRLVRADGVALGFTTHDKPFAFDGLEYCPAPGFEPSAIEAASVDGGHAMEMVGALTAEAIRDDDIEVGRYDGASVRAFLIDWADRDAGGVELTSGRLGQIDREAGAFTAELRTAIDELSASPIETYSPECRAQFGDRRCRVDLSRHTRLATVSAVASTRIGIDGNLGGVDDYKYGRLRLLSGPLVSIDRMIIGSGNDFVLLEAAADGTRTGDLVELRHGCDKRFATCRDRFANALNFRGEPHVPGADSLGRYGALA